MTGVPLTFPGKVTRIADALDPGTRTLLTEIDIPNPDGALKPGTYCTVELHVPHSRSGHWRERTGFQFKPGVTHSTGALIKSGPGRAQPPARYQYFARPSTCAVAGTFTVDERQRTGDAARCYDAATCAAVAHAPFRRPTGPSPFRFPISDGSLTGASPNQRPQYR